MMKVEQLHHIALTVTDIDRSVPWYQRVLGLAEAGRREEPDTGLRTVFLRPPGDEFVVVLTQRPGATQLAPYDGAAGLDHIAFRVASTDELRTWEEHLASHRVAYVPARNSLVIPGASAVLFQDPDAIQLEIIAEAG
jgi:glyoxylase I family protein